MTKYTKCQKCNSNQIQHIYIKKWRRMYRCRICYYHIYHSPNYYEIDNNDLAKRLVYKVFDKGNINK